MTKYGYILDKLDPLTKVQYYGVLNKIDINTVILGIDLQKEWQEDLGLTPNQYKKAIKFLTDANLITIDEYRGQIVATLTEAAREIV